jgi:hypothetical protein
LKAKEHGEEGSHLWLGRVKSWQDIPEERLGRNASSIFLREIFLFFGLSAKMPQSLALLVAYF